MKHETYWALSIETPFSSAETVCCADAVRATRLRVPRQPAPLPAESTAALRRRRRSRMILARAGDPAPIPVEKLVRWLLVATLVLAATALSLLAGLTLGRSTSASSSTSAPAGGAALAQLTAPERAPTRPDRAR